MNGTNIEKPFIELGESILNEINNGSLNPNELSANGIKVKADKKSMLIKPIDPNIKAQ